MTYSKFIITISCAFICFGLALITPGATQAETLQVDLTRTYAKSLNRYCFAVVNDDLNETEEEHLYAIGSFTLNFSYERPYDHDTFRGNVTTPTGWQGGLTETDDVLQGGDMVTSGTFEWWTSVINYTVAPGDRSDAFCFVIKGEEITVTSVEFGFLDAENNEAPDETNQKPYYDTYGYTENPFGKDTQITEKNDTDFLYDRDRDGIAYGFDKNPYKKD